MIELRKLGEFISEWFLQQRLPESRECTHGTPLSKPLEKLLTFNQNYESRKMEILKGLAISQLSTCQFIPSISN